MTQQLRIPDSETRKRNVANMRAACQQLEAFTLALDKLIAQLEADIRRSPRNAYLLSKGKRLEEKSGE